MTLGDRCPDLRRLAAACVTWGSERMTIRVVATPEPTPPPEPQPLFPRRRSEWIRGDRIPTPQNHTARF